MFLYIALVPFGSIRITGRVKIEDLDLTALVHQ
jgi:hypothetical protein